MMSLSLSGVGMVVADGGDTAAYLWATSRVAHIAVPAIEEDY